MRMDSMFFKPIILLFITSIMFFSCTKSSAEKNRYIVLSHGELPVILDTETKEVYVISPYDGESPDIYKGSLTTAK